MSGYNSLREVREVTQETLRMEGRNPADYNVSGIMRDAFYARGPGYGYGAAPEQEWRDAVTRHRKRSSRPVSVQRKRAECIMDSRHNRCETCITTGNPGQPCDCQCPVCVAAQASDRPRFAITASVHGWRWTYTGIRAAEAQWIAATLAAGSGETWTVTEIQAAAG